jgi:hypothetical protein
MTVLLRDFPLADSSSKKVVEKVVEKRRLRRFLLWLACGMVN